jgi:pyridoxal phosphate enzyme (YggS family)
MDLQGTVADVRDRMAAACRRVGRDPGSVTLVAVTKTVPLRIVREAREAGVADLAENYANELASKARAVPATWHFVGKLQRGTAAAVADHAQVVHSAEPGRAMERVAARAARNEALLRYLVQVDFTGRRQGVAPDMVGEAVGRLAELDGIQGIGLMTLPPWTGGGESARPYFARLRKLRDELLPSWPGLRELSMGMSDDYEVAIEEGATMVRVGTALFGARPIPPADE